MKYLVYILLCSSILISCKQKNVADIDLEKYVYMAQANQINRKVIDINKTSDTTYYGASISGLNPAMSNVNVEFTVNSEAIEDYNDNNDTEYVAMPIGSYSFQSTGIIMSGNVTTNDLILVVDVSKLEPFNKYMLPIQVKSISSDYIPGKKNHTAYFVYDLIPNIDDYERYDYRNWSIHSYSTHQPWLDTDDGHIRALLLDEKGNTYWISQFSTPGPHWVIIDMKEEKEVHGVSYINRTYEPWHPPADGYPKHITLEISSDANNWEKILDVDDIPFPLETRNIWVNHFAQKFKKGRYFRFTAVKHHTLHTVEFNLGKLTVF